MAEPVSLRAVADELDALMDGMTAYINRRTGALYSVSDDDVRMVDENADSDALPQWEREMLTTIREILDSGDWLKLPTKFDLHEWAIMDEFSRSVDDPDLQDDLLRAIRGAGAFRRFGDAVRRAGIEDRWFRHKAAALEQIAAEWLDEHGIPYRREP